MLLAEIMPSSFAARDAAQDDKEFREHAALQRPIVVSIISLLCCAAAVYLWIVAAARLISPRAISLMSGRHLMHGLELAGPFMMLLIGTGYAVVGWGLFRLYNWARVIVILLTVIEVAALVPKISMAQLGVPILWYGLQIALSVAIGWYLAQAPSVIDAFAHRHTSRSGKQ